MAREKETSSALSLTDEEDNTIVPPPPTRRRGSVLDDTIMRDMLAHRVAPAEGVENDEERERMERMYVMLRWSKKYRQALVRDANANWDLVDDPHSCPNHDNDTDMRTNERRGDGGNEESDFDMGLDLEDGVVGSSVADQGDHNEGVFPGHPSDFNGGSTATTTARDRLYVPSAHRPISRSDMAARRSSMCTPGFGAGRIFSAEELDDALGKPELHADIVIHPSSPSTTISTLHSLSNEGSNSPLSMSLRPVSPSIRSSMKTSSSSRSSSASLSGYRSNKGHHRDGRKKVVTFNDDVIHIPHEHRGPGGGSDPDSDTHHRHHRNPNDDPLTADKRKDNQSTTTGDADDDTDTDTVDEDTNTNSLYTTTQKDQRDSNNSSSRESDKPKTRLRKLSRTFKKAFGRTTKPDVVAIRPSRLSVG
ncbi:hypothetical protein BC832DRAFT_591395 [Gaertneriomyces semiglobifer]|nr:hypothetical protein BC832DRAFT_591395 [Gaertneriomyces semiglobifer]